MVNLLLLVAGVVLLIAAAVLAFGPVAGLAATGAGCLLLAWIRETNRTEVKR